ncbi:MAG: lipid-A-disaccharide synthase [Bdellovibrionales bacterium]|nr:lipid-A-disaccharide synthase [Bdellovibrionales bacterium]
MKNSISITDSRGAPSKRVLIVSAEASSNLYAIRLLQHWKATGVRVKAFGIGNYEMETLGFECLGRAEELAVMGAVEVIKHFPEIRQTFYKLVDAVKKGGVDLVVLMDYPDFNFRLAKKIKSISGNTKIVYYISPQIWVWRQGRVHFIKKYIDHVICLFPFEVEFYKRFQVSASFEGHPLIDEIQTDPRVSSGQVKEQREKLGFSGQDVVLGLMPGSRHGEIENHFDIQIQTAEILSQEFPNLKVALLVAPGLNVADLKARLPQNLSLRLLILERPPFEMIALTDVILAASGTATLMVGLLLKPMVIMYKFKPFSAWIAKTFFTFPKFFGIVNLILDRMVAPEIFQEAATPENLAEALRPYLKSAEARLAKAEELGELSTRLGSPGVTKRVAQRLTDFWGNP